MAPPLNGPYVNEVGAVPITTRELVLPSSMIEVGLFSRIIELLFDNVKILLLPILISPPDGTLIVVEPLIEMFVLFVIVTSP